MIKMDTSSYGSFQSTKTSKENSLQEYPSKNTNKRRWCLVPVIIIVILIGIFACYWSFTSYTHYKLNTLSNIVQSIDADTTSTSTSSFMNIESDGGELILEYNSPDLDEEELDLASDEDVIEEIENELSHPKALVMKQKVRAILEVGKGREMTDNEFVEYYDTERMCCLIESCSICVDISWHCCSELRAEDGLGKERQLEQEMNDAQNGGHEKKND